MLAEVRERVEFNRDVDVAINIVLEHYEEEVAKLELTKLEVSDLEEKQIGVCDSIHERYPNRFATDEEALAHYVRLEEKYEDER
ncbi:MAG: hypothetical protein DRG33_07825 [Deltaproteobacteria bacterium]|nr:MAG: hypothetical protein DRG33_07825 [Deltaproteobacteria bacterium]